MRELVSFQCRKGLSTVAALVLISGVVLIIVVMVTFMNMDDSLATERFSTKAVYVGEYVAAAESSIGGQSSKYYQFELPNSEIVNIQASVLSPDKKTRTKGESATVFFRKGHFTKRPLYDSFEFSP